MPGSRKGVPRGNLRCCIPWHTLAYTDLHLLFNRFIYFFYPFLTHSPFFLTYDKLFHRRFRFKLGFSFNCFLLGEMDSVRGDDASSPKPNIYAAAEDDAEYVYSTEGSDDDNVAKYEVVPQAVKKSRISHRSKGWTERETFVLLESWGERLLKDSRRSVSSDEWFEISDKVSEVSKVHRTKTHCRNRMDTMKRSYKKEKAMLAENANYSSNWVFFTLMNKIVTSSLNRSDPSLNSNETNQIENSEVQPERAGLSDEVKEDEVKEDEVKEDSLKEDSESEKDENDNLENSPPKEMMRVSVERGSGDAFELLSDSNNNFENVDENVQNSKPEYLDELDELRINIKRELEMESEKILKKSKLKIAKIWGVKIKDDDHSIPRNM